MLNKYANSKFRPYTRMWVTIQNDNRHQILDFVELAKQMGFRRLTFSMSLSGWSSDIWNQRNQHRQIAMLSEREQELLLRENEKGDLEIMVWGDGARYKAGARNSLCPMPFSRAYISSDQRVLPCSSVGTPDIADFGAAESLSEIWQGKKFTKFREAHIKGRIPKFCQGCYDI